MTHDERTMMIRGWLERFLKRKSTPRRLEDDQAVADEFSAMVGAINRRTPSEANKDQLSHWLERLGGFLDEQDIPSWPSIGEVVKHYKRVLPDVTYSAPAASEQDQTEVRGARLAQEWLRSPAARRHFEDGSHVNAAQWIRRNGSLPDAQQCAEIRSSTNEISAFIDGIRTDETSRSMRFAMLTAARSIIEKRISAYDAGRKFHPGLPEDAPWLDAAIAMLGDERDAQLATVERKTA